MIHIALADSTIEAFAACGSRVIVNVAVPEGSSIRQVPHGAMSEVSGLRLRFTDGAELELWPESVATSMESSSFELESFILCAEFRSKVLLVSSGRFRAQQKFVEVPALNTSLSHCQVRSVNVCSSVERADSVIFRVDSSIQMTLDASIIEFVTHHPNVMPMSLGIQFVAPARGDSL